VKRRRNAITLDWNSLVSGDAAVSPALNASVGRE